MSFRPLAILLTVFFLSCVANAQGGQSQIAAQPATEKVRDLPFASGIDLQFIIKELARDLDLNVLFDAESFRAPRRTIIELKNVSTMQAIESILLQEALCYERTGPNTILIANKGRCMSIPQLGFGLTTMGPQLAEYFDVKDGMLVNWISPGSPAEKGGLKAGDVIVEADGDPANGVSHIRSIIEKNAGQLTLTVVRKGKRHVLKLVAGTGPDQTPLK